MISLSVAISDDDLEEIEKVVEYIREGRYTYPLFQVVRIERICRRIRAAQKDVD